MNKEEDKRLLIPRDEFEEEASEGLGRLNREEAEEDLRELRGRIERRVRKPRTIWLPAAAAVIILLVASTVYIALFRDRSKPEAEIAMTKPAITDTALIAMAQPVTVSKAKSPAPVATPNLGVAQSETTDELVIADAAYDKVAEDKDEVVTILEAVEEEEVAEEMAEVVIVEAIPGMEKAAAAEKKERAADAAATTPRLGVGTPDRQAAPVGGMEEFNSWLQKNIKYPEKAMPGVQKMVVVTFKVKADSTLYDFKAERTPGELFTREAFRLLREGPKWVPAVRNGKVSVEEVRVSIVFK